MRVDDPTMPDSRIVDDLDVGVVLAELGLEMGSLDEALAETERAANPLEALWQVPPGLEDRVARRVRERLRIRDTAWLVADLMGLGWSTTRAVIEPGHGDWQ